MSRFWVDYNRMKGFIQALDEIADAYGFEINAVTIDEWRGSTTRSSAAEPTPPEVTIQLTQKHQPREQL